METRPPANRTEEAVERILVLVRDEKLSADDRLPSERMLEQRLRLGRTPLNKAVACLIAQGHLRRVGYKLYPTGYLAGEERAAAAGAAPAPPIHVLYLPYRTENSVSISLSLHEAAHDVAEERGSHTIPMISHTGVEQCRQVESLLRRGTNGFVLWPHPDAPLESLLRHCRDHGVPFVLCDLDLGPFDFVGVDNEEGMRLAVEHLHALGHRKIVYFTQSLAIPSLRRRCGGYVQACRSLGLRSAARSIIEIPSFDPLHVKDAFDQFRAKFANATAVAFSNDVGAIYFMQMAREASIRVPEDLSIVGFDDIDAAGLVTPKLTTVAQNFYQSGVIATQLLYHLINNAKKGRPVEPYRARTEPRLIVRESAAARRV